MAADLPLYKADTNGGLKRPRYNKRLIITCALLGVGFIFYLNAHLTASQQGKDQGTITSEMAGDDYQPLEPSYPDYKPDNNTPDPALVEVDTKTDSNQHEADGTKDPFSPSTHSNSHNVMKQPFDDATDNNAVINTSKHYSQLVVVTSEASSLERRRLIRDKYFGLRDNLLPCMVYNADVYYKFLIHGGPPASDTPLRRQYEAEKMEWNDLVELSTSSYEVVDVLEWVRQRRKRRNGNHDFYAY